MWVLSCTAACRAALLACPWTEDASKPGLAAAQQCRPLSGLRIGAPVGPAAEPTHQGQSEVSEAGSGSMSQARILLLRTKTKLKHKQQQALGRQNAPICGFLKIGVQTAAQQAEPLQRSVEQCATLRCSNCIELLNLLYVLALRAHDHHAPLLLRAWLDGRPHLMQTNMLLEPGRTNCTAAGHTVLGRLSCTQP